MSNDIDTYETEEPLCPNCGYKLDVDVESFFKECDEQTIKCSACGTNINATMNASWTTEEARP